MARGALLALGVAAATAAGAAPAAPTACVACHGDRSLFPAEKVHLVMAFAADVHATVELSCHDCHGGNPDPALAGDMAASMDPGYRPQPFVGVPARSTIPAFCGRCHSDPILMKRYKPDARVDQEREYRTSRHGELLARGDDNVATCIDCHGTHDIRPPTSADSRVHPKNVARTCASCHADAKRMAGYTRPDGRPLPIDQHARWMQSVHATALLQKEDVSAPTCNDCHGNHGATPPGVDSVAFVCGQCHGREAALFRASQKHAGFETHHEFLAASSDGCKGCHAPPEPAARFATDVSLTECVGCHGSHGVVRPTVAMLSPLPPTPCELCHAYPEDDEGAAVAAADAERRRFEPLRDALLQIAESQGLRDAARFDWLVDRALELPTHTIQSGSEEPRLREEFRRLFTKFRIGKTHYTYADPSTGETVRANVVRCSDCHPEPAAGASVGGRTSAALAQHMASLTTLVARAERLLLAARRGGVETRRIGPEIDQALNAQIELEVLVHTFTADAGSEFMAKVDGGMTHARTAITGARHALEELEFRRRGLAVFLGFLILVLAALGLKIRQLSRDDRGS